MSFAVHWTDAARDDMADLPTSILVRVARKVEAARENPFRSFERLRGVTAWRLRIGDYRVLADIDARKRTIFVLKVAHRRSVYQR